MTLRDVVYLMVAATASILSMLTGMAVLFASSLSILSLLFWVEIEVPALAVVVPCIIPAWWLIGQIDHRLDAAIARRFDPHRFDDTPVE